MTSAACVGASEEPLQARVQRLASSWAFSKEAGPKGSAKQRAKGSSKGSWTGLGGEVVRGVGFHYTARFQGLQSKGLRKEFVDFRPGG